MAIYVATCKACGKEVTYHKPIAQRDETPQCCGEKMDRKLVAPMGYVDVPAAGR